MDICVRNLSGNQVVEHYRKMLEAEISAIGSNEVCILNDDELKQIAELRVRKCVPENYVLENQSQIVVYTQSIEKILERHRTLETFWKKVQSEIISRLGCMAVLILHKDKKTAHIHLLLKTKEKMSRTDLACWFDEVFIHKNGSSDIFEYPFSYYYEPLLDVYEMFQKDINCDTEGVITLYTTSDFAEYYVKAKSL